MFRKHDNASVEGLLTVSSAVPGGPGASFLEPGDILLRINGSAITVFAELEGALDSNVGKVMSFEVMRGGELIKKDVEVQDLHEITPKSYVEVGDCVLNDLSYVSPSPPSPRTPGNQVSQALWVAPFISTRSMLQLPLSLMLTSVFSLLLLLLLYSGVLLLYSGVYYYYYYYYYYYFFWGGHCQSPHYDSYYNSYYDVNGIASYHNAKHNNLPVGGVYVAKAGYILKRAGIAAGTMISKVNGQPVKNVRELCAGLATGEDGQQIPIRVHNVRNPHVEGTAVVRMDRRWFPMRYVQAADFRTCSRGRGASSSQPSHSHSLSLWYMAHHRSVLTRVHNHADTADTSCHRIHAWCAGTCPATTLRANGCSTKHRRRQTYRRKRSRGRAARQSLQQRAR